MQVVRSDFWVIGMDRRVVVRESLQQDIPEAE